MLYVAGASSGVLASPYYLEGTSAVFTSRLWPFRYLGPWTPRREKKRPRGPRLRRGATLVVFAPTRLGLCICGSPLELNLHFAFLDVGFACIDVFARGGGPVWQRVAPRFEPVQPLLHRRAASAFLEANARHPLIIFLGLRPT